MGIIVSPTYSSLMVSWGGIIDWDCAGLADPYMDFVSCVWSIGYNYGEKDAEEKWVPLFFDSYGIQPDTEKLRYYNKLRNSSPD